MNAILSISMGGIHSAMQRMQQAAGHVASASAPGSGRDIGDAEVLSELMAVRVANNVIASNAALIRRWDEALGSLLDVRA